MYPLLRQALFGFDPTTAHTLGMAALSVPEYLPIARWFIHQLYSVKTPALRVHTMGLTFPNPIGIAAGFDKDGRRARALQALGFGHVELGTVTAQAQEANPVPNLFRLPLDKALINRLGFPNRGAKHLAARLHAHRPSIPVGISIGKSRAVPIDDKRAVLEDYRTSFDAVRNEADFVVLNISSPNTPHLRRMQSAHALQALVEHLVQARNEKGRYVPLLIKIAPDLASDEVDAILDIVLASGLEGIVATNTTVLREGLRTPPEQLDSMGAGGLSGAPLKPRVKAMVTHARARLGPDRTIIGVGGVSCADDVRELLGAGATLCQMYTGFIYEGPGVAYRICHDLADQPLLPSPLTGVWHIDAKTIAYRECGIALSARFVRRAVARIGLTNFIT